MSKILFRTIKIKVPEEFIIHDKNGNITIKHTLTKTRMPTKIKGEPSIDLIPAEIDHAEIINKGEKVNDVAGLKKVRKSRKKAIETFKEEVIGDIKPARNLRKWFKQNKKDDYPPDAKSEFS